MKTHLSPKEKPSLNPHTKPIQDLEEALEASGVKASPGEIEAMQRAHALYPLKVNRYFLGLAESRSLNDPILLQALPNPGELLESPFSSEDPLGEESHTPVPHLIHRYPDRVVLLVTSRCAVRCRHCNRKRFWRKPEWVITPGALEEVTGYLKRTPTVREVILSGGDPLTLEPERLRAILEKLRTAPRVKVIRIGTRVPVTAPWLVSERLMGALEGFQPIWINLQFNHPLEITPESKDACDLLRRGGAVLGNQTVLLRGVNDSPKTIRELCYLLVEMGIRPYYLFQCDPVRGVEHLRTPVKRGIEIIQSMIGHASGLAVPTFAIDAPGGKGKVPLLPDYRVSFEKGGVRFLSYAGEVGWYPDQRGGDEPSPAVLPGHRGP